MENVDLKKLKDEIPYMWRVQSSNQYGATCVAYIDSRDVQDVFDSVCGQGGWADEYYPVNGKLYCKIGVEVEPGFWVWKSDCGAESNIEAEKGESSDAFKRAAVKWGVGRFLYSLRVQRLKTIEGKGGKWNPFYEHNGQKVEIKTGEILTKYINSLIKKK